MNKIESLIAEIEEFQKKHTSYKDQAKTYKMILEAQKPLLEDSKAGTTIDWTATKFLDKLQKRSLEEELPISSFLEPAIYDFQALQKTFLAVMEGFKSLNIESPEKISRLINNASKLIPEIVEKRLQYSFEFFLSLADKFGLSHTFLGVIADTLIQPSMKKIANNVKKEDFLDQWNKTECPVCKRIPFIAVKDEEEVWRFLCAFCEAEYAMYIFKCPNCENEDFKRKEFFFVDGREAFEAACCKECGCYFKIINKYKLKEKIPVGLEDIYTSFLDELAQDKGLKRLDALKPQSGRKNRSTKH